MLYKVFFITTIMLILFGCSTPPKNQATNLCGNGRTDLDGVCVRQDVADFASCVRSQSAELGQEENKSLSAEVGYLGVNVSGASELRKKLSKKYSASDEVMMQIINRCGSLVGNNGNSIPKKHNMKVVFDSCSSRSLDMSIDCNL